MALTPLQMFCQTRKVTATTQVNCSHTDHLMNQGGKEEWSESQVYPHVAFVHLNEVVEIQQSPTKHGLIKKAGR